DNVGNTSSVQTTVKVDTSDPTINLSFANLTGATARNGTRVYFKPNAAGGGSFDVTGNGVDNDTDIASYGFPTGAALGTNWSASGSGPTRTYSFSATATTHGSQSVSTSNNAGRSANTSFDLTADSNAPAGGGALTVNGTAASGGGSTSYDSDGDFAIGSRRDWKSTRSTSSYVPTSYAVVRSRDGYSSAHVCGSFG